VPIRACRRPKLRPRRTIRSAAKALIFHLRAANLGKRTVRSLSGFGPALVAFGAIGVACLGSALAQSDRVKAIFENYNLLGTFALDCSKPASEKNWYFIYRPIDESHVQRDMMVGPSTRKFVFVFDKASTPGPSEITMGSTRDGEPIESTYRVEQNRHLEIEATLRGKKVIAEAKFVDGGGAVPWLNKCGAL
jgi:hypothetical protein